MNSIQGNCLSFISEFQENSSIGRFLRDSLIELAPSLYIESLWTCVVWWVATSHLWLIVCSNHGLV